MGLLKWSGGTWTSYNTFQNSGIPTDFINSVAVDKYGNVWAGTVNAGVVYYNGTTWRHFTNENSGLTENRVTSVMITPDHKIYMGTTSSGFVVFDEQSVLGVNDNGIRPSALDMLGASAPNPFSGTTTIRLALPQREQVRLSVMNAQGEEVAVLKEGLLEQGEHSIPFNALDLPSGVYFTRLVVNGVVESQPVVLAR